MFCKAILPLFEAREGMNVKSEDARFRRIKLTVVKFGNEVIADLGRVSGDQGSTPTGTWIA